MQHNQEDDAARRLNLKDAARLIGISNTLLAYYIKTDRGPASKTIAGVRSFLPEDVLAWDATRPTSSKPVGRPRRNKQEEGAMK